MSTPPEARLDKLGSVETMGVVRAHPAGEFGEWDAGEDTAPIPPRAWLLGTTFCRRYISCLMAGGGAGKSALRVAQCLAVATGRPITGEYVFRRARVLIVSLEDDADELRRRVRAAMLHHSITLEEVKGWLFLATPAGMGWKIAQLADGKVVAGELGPELEKVIRHRQIDLVVLDPFIKAHACEENANGQIDLVVGILAQIASACNCAIDAPHHVAKGASDPGNADRGRGASAFKDAARLVYTLATMTSDEADTFGIGEAERRLLIRVDSAKVNLVPAAAQATWFRLIGVSLNNGNEEYPHGDEVQTVEPWTPPDVWGGLSHAVLNEILTAIDKGLSDNVRYSDSPAARDRAAWKVVVQLAPQKSEQQARKIIKTWVTNGLLTVEEYQDLARREPVMGLRVNNAKRPT